MALPASLHVHPHFNPEEAANAASEFVASLDNLPGEVVFLLEEIREKDVRINQLVQRINTRHMGLTKSAKSLVSGTLPAPSSASGTSTPPILPSTPGAPLPTAHLTHKDAQALTKIQGEWGKVETLQEEKIKLAERMERIVNRARERGRAEWERVGGMEIDDLELNAGRGDKKFGPGGMFGELGGGEVVLPPGGLGSGTDGRPQKKRKPDGFPLPPAFTQPIIHPPSSMPPPPAPHGHGHSRPSLSARSSTSQSFPHAHGQGQRGGRHVSVSIMSDMDADGEGEYDPDADADAENAADEGTEADDTLYCLCQQRSYGEMIGCDNDKCEYEWFHVKCVNISGALPDTWYCPPCVQLLGFSSSDGKVAGQNRKGRKK